MVSLIELAIKLPRRLDELAFVLEALQILQKIVAD
jgi:hypothetical protein